MFLSSTRFLSCLEKNYFSIRSAHQARGLLLADGAPKVGWGKTFWRVEKSIRRCQIDHLAEGYNQAIEEIRGPMAKKRIIGPKSEAVFRHRLPKVALLGLKRCFWPASKNCYNREGTPKRQPFGVDCIAGWSLGGRSGPFRAQKTDFLCFAYITHLFGLSRTRLKWSLQLYYILQYCMVLHCWLRRVGCISQDTFLLYDKYFNYQNIFALDHVSCRTIILDKYFSNFKSVILHFPINRRYPNSFWVLILIQFVWYWRINV